MGKVSVRYDSRDALKRCPYKPVARRIEREFIEPARNLPTVEKAVGKRGEQIDVSPYPRQHRRLTLIAPRKVPPHPPFNLARQKLTDEVGQIIEIGF